jgi:glycosyltransferase involved in cell wall biosynthesis
MTGSDRQDGRRSVAIIGTRGYPSYYGGFETAVRKLAPYLSDQDWDVTVYGRVGSTRTDDPSVDSRVTRVQTWGVNNKSLSTLSYGLSATLHALWRKPDVALVMNVANGFWLPLLKMRGVPTVVNVDGIEWHRAKWGRFAKAMFRWGARFTARFGDHLVYDAKAIEDFWARDFGRGGTFIPYGGDPVDKLPVEAGLTSGRYVLVVARFVPENTIHEFFDAAEKLAASGTDVVIVGSSGGSGGELDDRALQLDATWPTIRWLGHVSDDQRLFALWQHAGAYFHGHSVGGTNPALVQAMAAGAPILARDTVYNREVLAEAGRFVEPEVDAIVSSVQALLDDPSDLQSRAIKRSSVRYNWPDVCADYAAVLDGESRYSDHVPSRRSN